jgi:elongation factor G
VVDFKVTLYDGSYHEVDSSEMAFKIAGSLAFRKGMEQARPVLLEPIMKVEVYVPEENSGDIMGDLNGRSARVLGMEPEGGKTAIKAQVAEAELHKYASALRSITQGRGFHRRKMLGYDYVPAVRVEKIVAEAKEGDE